MGIFGMGRNPDVFVIPANTGVSVNTGPRYVHEHRAPTDESVRLLREMEEKARAQVIEQIRVGDTACECVIRIEKSMHDDTVMLTALFSLNGRRMTADHIERTDKYDKRTALIALRDAMARRIATEILAPALDYLKV